MNNLDNILQKNKDQDLNSIAHKILNNERISFKDGIPSMPPTPGNEALVNVLSDISMALNYGEVKAGNAEHGASQCDAIMCHEMQHAMVELRNVFQKSCDRFKCPMR